MVLLTGTAEHLLEELELGLGSRNE